MGGDHRSPEPDLATKETPERRTYAAYGLVSDCMDEKWARRGGRGVWLGGSGKIVVSLFLFITYIIMEPTQPAGVDKIESEADVPDHQ